MDKLEVITSYWRAEGKMDIDKVLTYYADDAQMVSPLMTLEGIDNIRIYYEKMATENESLEVTPVNTVEQGDEIAVEWALKLVKKGGQVRSAEGCNVFSIKDNKIQRLRAYFNPSDF